jgi:UDP-N-acetylmuramoyl-tripeptide--D-alanyl-D-alanine ligase
MQLEGATLVLVVLALCVRLAGRQHRLLHLFQLEHYEPARLMLWLKRRDELYSSHELLGVAVLFGLATALAAAGQGWAAGAALLATTPWALLGVNEWRSDALKPLVFTARARRLLATSLLPAALILLAAVALALAGATALGIGVILAICWMLVALAPQTLVLANRLLAPIQGAVNRRFVQSAQQTLAKSHPLVVGITGSYGKTTTKFCVGEVLSVAHPTLVTPESYNSYLGVVKTINERLHTGHEAFVVEMGMFRQGDIAELCQLVRPSIGVITAIGPMHLERLGSIEAIAQAKAELAQALPADGHLIVNADDPRCNAIAKDCTARAMRFGIESPTADVRASRIRLDAGHTEFELHLPQSSPVSVRALLLGTHNVYNLLAAAAVGHVFGMEPNQIAHGLGRVQAPEHRLQPIHNRRAGIVVIDDAYNSNPQGATTALEVLRQHDAKRRMLVTPGMVELGTLESELNRRFGEQAADVCDVVILVGSQRTRPIYEGLMAAGFDGANVKVVDDIAAATKVLGELTRSGDVVLFENDLPDTYTELGLRPTRSDRAAATLSG